MKKIIKERKRRSEALTIKEHKAFIKLFHSFPTTLDAADYFGLTRQVLYLVEIKGTGRWNTIAAIREKLASQQES